MVNRSLSREEALARAALLHVASYDVELSLSHAETFGSRSTIRFDCREPGASSFVELGSALTSSATLNGAEIPSGAFDGNRIRLDRLRATNELVVTATLPCVTSGDGMQRTADPADGEVYLNAFCGMDVAQRVFACFDQADLKATMALSVTAPEHWSVLGNGKLVLQDGAVRRFATTPPISTYLFTLGAGPWHSATWEHAGLPFGWHARGSLAAALDRDLPELKRVTESCFDYYTSVFDEPYAFDSYDQVMAPGLNWGAMEFPGCVAFRDEFLHPDGASEAQRQRRAMVIAHEMAHMWFGDLVTMRWWEDAWLSESFADYMGFEVAGAAAGFAGTWTSFTLTDKLGAYAADQRRSTHPVAPTAESVTDTDTAFGNFDQITYAKGNSVVRQLATWLGEENFLLGVNRYLSTHRLNNADLGDFLAALDSVCELDVRSWADVWLRQTGFDTLRVRYDGQTPVLSRDGRRPHRMLVTSYDVGEVSLTRRGSRMVDLADDEVRLEEWTGTRVLPNSLDQTFARLRTDHFDALLARLGSIQEPETRAVVWATAFDLVEQGHAPAPGLIDLARGQLGIEQLPMIWEPVVERLLATTLPRHLAGPDAALAKAVLADVADATTTPALLLPAARAFACCTDDPERLLDWLDAGHTESGIEVNRQLRWLVLARLAELDAITEARIDEAAARDRSSDTEVGAARARAARPTVAAKASAWGQASHALVGNRVFTATMRGLWIPEQGDLVAPYVERYLAEAPLWAARRGQGFSLEVGHAYPRHAVDQTTRVRLERALAGKVPTVLRRVWNDRLDDLTADLRVRRAPA